MEAKSSPALCFAITLIAATLWPQAAAATENATPFASGFSAGIPAGALPAPGFYFNYDLFMPYASKLVDSKGNTAPLRFINYDSVASLTWVPEWHIFGAQYAATVTGLYAVRQVNTTGLGGYRSTSNGFFNPIITPAVLSWNLGNGLYTSAGVNLYVPPGGISHYKNGKTLQTSYSNDYWTVEPSWAITYLHNGWDITLNNLFDFNTRNHATDYLSGNFYYLDATVTKTRGPWTLGIIGNYTRQFSDDRQYGKLVNHGNRLQTTLSGPLLGYDFGKAQLTLRYMKNLRTRNYVSFSYVSAAISFRL